MAAVGSGEFTELSREEQQTHDWRIEQFEALGFDQEQVHRLESWGVDWHEAAKLVARGWPLHWIVRVLA